MIRRFADGETFAIGGDEAGVAHMVEIVERLAHAHQHDIGDLALGVGQAPLVRRGGAGPVAEPVAGERDLADDLARGQIAHETLRAGIAEGTGERAADLARNAERAAIFLGDVDGLDLLAVFEAKQPFAGAVDRDLLGHDLRAARAQKRAASSPRSSLAMSVMTAKSVAPRT